MSAVSRTVAASSRRGIRGRGQCAGDHGRKLGERADLTQRHAAVRGHRPQTDPFAPTFSDDAGRLVTRDEESVGVIQLGLAAHNHVVRGLTAAVWILMSTSPEGRG